MIGYHAYVNPFIKHLDIRAQALKEWSMQEGLEARVARLEGEVAHMARRLDSMDNWLRVIVGLQVTTMLSMAAGFVALIRLIA